MLTTSYFDDLQFDILMQVFLSATFSRLYRVLEDFHVLEHRGGKFLLIFLFQPLSNWHKTCL